MSLGPESATDEADIRWDAASKALEKGHVRDALNIMLEAASRGEWLAYCEIGRIYELGGNGVPRDAEEALYWYRRSIFEADDPNAHFGIGQMYYEGKGLEQNHKKARDHLEKALTVQGPMELNARNRVTAYVHLFHLYNRFLLDELDSIKARSFLEAGAREGYAWPLFLLSSLELKKGHLLCWLRLRLRAAKIVGLSKYRSDDPMLTGCVLPPKSLG